VSHQHIFDRILESNTFRERELYQKLLVYLYDAYLKGIIPKEISIAQDIFGKGKDFNAAEDTTVRVHMHNLRNKLEQYYHEEGLKDEIKLSIPKGHYKIEFSKDISYSRIKELNKNNIILFLSLSLLLISIFYIILDKFIIAPKYQFATPVDPDNTMWKQFFNNNYPNSLVVGDFLVFHEFNTDLNRARRIQDYQINTLDELNTYIQSNPDKDIDTWLLGELPHNIIFNIVDLQRVFIPFTQKFDINFTSNIDINFIKNKNIIFIGEFKNLRSLSNLITNLPVQYQTLPWWEGTLTFQRDDSVSILKTFRDWGVSRYVVDLGMIAKLPGSNNENYLLIAGFGYDSQVKLVKMLSENSALEELEKQVKELNGHFPDYFVMAFEIRGFDRASTTAEMHYFQEIDQDYYKKNY